MDLSPIIEPAILYICTPKRNFRAQFLFKTFFVSYTFQKSDMDSKSEPPHLRMYCIDTPGVPESSDEGTFHCLYDYGSIN